MISHGEVEEAREARANDIHADDNQEDEEHVEQVIPRVPSAKKTPKRTFSPAKLGGLGFTDSQPEEEEPSVHEDESDDEEIEEES